VGEQIRYRLRDNTTPRPAVAYAAPGFQLNIAAITTLYRRDEYVAGVVPQNPLLSAKERSGPT